MEKRSPVVAVAPFVPFRLVTLPTAISRKAQVEDTSPLLLPAVVPKDGSSPQEDVVVLGGRNPSPGGELGISTSGFTWSVELTVFPKQPTQLP